MKRAPLAIVLLLFFSNAAIAATDYRIVSIAPPGVMGQAWDVNNGGTVVGCLNINNEWRAYRWTNGALTDLGAGCATAINAAGLIGGHTPAGDLVLWNGSTTTPLGINGDITGINTQGLVVGSYKDSAGATHGFTWYAGQLTTLPDVPGSTTTLANGVNAPGQVVYTGAGRGFVYRNGQSTEIPGINGSGSATPNAINNDGVVVGMGSDRGPAAFVYANGQTTRVPGSPGYSSAVAINNVGQILGSAEGSYGYLCDGGACVNLSSFPGVQAATWRHLEPSTLNDNGWIVGSGANLQGDNTPFVMIPATAGNNGNGNGPSNANAGGTNGKGKRRVAAN